MALKTKFSKKERLAIYKEIQETLPITHQALRFICGILRYVLEKRNVSCGDILYSEINEFFPEFRLFKPMPDDEFYINPRNTWFNIVSSDEDSPMFELERMICLDFCILMAEE